MLTYAKLGRLGDFGNQLFQIASTIGIAKMSGYEYGFPEWKNYIGRRKWFKHEYLQNYFINPLPKLPDDFKPSHEVEVPWGYHQINVPDNSSISGYLQSHKYFESQESLIRKYFELKCSSQIEMPKNSVAIHVRRGDFRSYYHQFLQEDYYQTAIDQFPVDSKFHVFSDSPKEARKLLKREDFNYVTGNHFIIDFAMMLACDHFITANSTFSWWAAWLGAHREKKVVIPRNWFGEFLKHQSVDDLFVPGWVILDNRIDS